MTGVTTTSTPSRPPSTRHRERLRRTIRVLHAAVLALFAVAVLGSLARGDGTAYHLAHGLLAAGLALGSLLVTVRGERADHLVLLVPLALATVLPVFREVGDVSAGLAINAVLLTAVRALPLGPCCLVLTGTVATHAGLRGVLDGGLTVAEVADPYLLSVSNIAVAGLLMASLERSTAEIDEASAEGEARTLALLRRESADRAVDGARRVLHDDVLTALRAVVDDANGPQRVRETCRAAVASVERLDGGWVGPGPDSLVDAGVGLGIAALLAEVAAASPVPVELPVRVGGPPAAALAPEVRDAAARALGEALRNAQRHAVGASVRMLARDAERDGPSGTGLVDLVVEDDGPGIGGGTEGFGLAESVRRPVEDVGGSVRLEPVDAVGGTGLRVVLTLPVRRDHVAPGGAAGAARASVREAFEAVVGAGAPRRLAVAAILPLVGFWTFVAVAEIPGSGSPVRHTLLLLALLTVTSAVSVRLAVGEPSDRWVLGVTAVLAGLQVLGLALMPAGGMLDLRGWSIGFVAVPEIILCFVLPVRWGLGLVATQVAVVLGAALVEPSLAGGGLPVNSLNAVTTPALLTTLLGVRLRRNATAAEVERERSWQVSAELVRREAQGEARSRHLDHTRRVVVPWLRRVAVQAGPTSSQQREEARLLALEARDDLHVPGFHTPGLRREVTDFRRAGGQVDLRPGLDAARREEGVVRLQRLLPLLPPGSRVTVTPYGAGPTGVRTVVTPPPPPGVVAALTEDADGAEVTCDDFLLVITTRSRGDEETGESA